MKTDKIIVAGIGPHLAFVPPPHPPVQGEIIIVNNENPKEFHPITDHPQIGEVAYKPLVVDNSKNYINGKPIPRKRKKK